MYKCSVCWRSSRPGEKIRRHVVYKPPMIGRGREIAVEHPVCPACAEAIERYGPRVIQARMEHRQERPRRPVGKNRRPRPLVEPKPNRLAQVLPQPAAEAPEQPERKRKPKQQKAAPAPTAPVDLTKPVSLFGRTVGGK